jgi:molybdate transport repressor ModE-like protein
MAGSKGSKYFDVFLQYKFSLNNNEGEEILNDKFISILNDIKSNGSIQAAAEKNNISYRKLWGDIKKAEDSLKFCITEKKRGGKEGGHTSLTEDGINMLNAFKELEQEFDKAIYNTAKRFFNTLNTEKQDDNI